MGLLSGPWAGDDGWPDPDPAEAVAAYLLTAGPGWPRPEGRSPAEFLARAFQPDAPRDVLFTGYFEPVLAARRAPGDGFCHPLYASPGDLRLSRAEIEAGALTGQGLEIAWLRDPLDAFLLQVQGSGRMETPEGPLRLNFAARNGLPYRSIGAELIRRGAIAPERMSLATIRDWAAAHPGEVPGLLRHNPSFVFFRTVDLPADCGPRGSLGASVTPWRSLAVDPLLVPLGSPVWVELDGPRPLRQILIAQDTGSAIRGARADIFTGTGPEAGIIAGAINHRGRITVLRPGGR